MLVKWIMWGMLGLILCGLTLREYRSSQVVGHAQYRFNLVVIAPESGVTFISFDPTERAVLAIPFPTNLAINSRKSGEYSLASLYKLGAYSGEGGEFARQKIQGFMRVPIPGYLVSTGGIRSGLIKAVMGRQETSLSKLDSMVLLWRLGRYKYRSVEESELTRAGVIDKNIYHPDRLQEYVGTRLFDWGIGETRETIAIINASGEDGLGSDMADFLTNLGMDVVMVRSAAQDELLDVSEWITESPERAEELRYIFENLFGFEQLKLQELGSEYRANVLLKVGKDAKELF